MSSELDIIKKIQQLTLSQSAEFAAIHNLKIADFMELADEVISSPFD